MASKVVINGIEIAGDKMIHFNLDGETGKVVITLKPTPEKIFKQVADSVVEGQPSTFVMFNDDVEVLRSETVGEVNAEVRFNDDNGFEERITLLNVL